MDTKETSSNMDANQINKFVMFGYNYPYDFIEKAWGHYPMMMNHLRGKFTDYQTRHGGEVMNRFWINLDSENQAVLTKYIEENYNP